MCLKPWNVKLQGRISFQNVLLTVLSSALGGRSKRVQWQSTSHPVRGRLIESWPWRGRGKPGIAVTSIVMEVPQSWFFNAQHRLQFSVVFHLLKDASVIPSRAIQSHFHPALPRATYSCPCVYVQAHTQHHTQHVRTPPTPPVEVLEDKRPLVWGWRKLGELQRAEQYRKPGHPGLLHCLLDNRWTNGNWVLEWHLQGTCRELGLRLLPSNVNCGQRHRELSTIKNTLAWNRNTHKAYGINTTKEDWTTFLSLLCRAMRLKKWQRWTEQPSFPSGWLVRTWKTSSADLAFQKLRQAQRCQILCYHTLATFNFICELTRF